MNAIGMLHCCGAHQVAEYDATVPNFVFPPEIMWRAQDNLTDPPSAPISCEDYEG